MRWWRVIFVVLCSLVVGSLLVDRGYAPPPREVIRHLADRPEVGTMFKDLSTDRFDATVFLFTVLVITPLAVLAGLIALAVGLIMIEVTIIPAGRRLGLPDGVMHGLVLVAAAGVVYTQASVWLSGSLRLLGLLARAYLIVST